MKLLKRIFDFYLDASIHVAVSVVALIEVTGLLMDFHTDHHLVWFVFFGTIACYNFIKYGVEAEKYIVVANSYHRYIQVFSFIGLGVAAYHAQFLSRDVWFVLVFLSALVGLYAVPVIPKAKNLRNLGYLKILMVAFVWGGTTVILPATMEQLQLTVPFHLEALQRFILVIVLMLPFEVRDLDYDDPSLRTIPQQYGMKGTRKIGYVLSLTFLGLTIFKPGVSWEEWLSKSLICLVLILMLRGTKRHQSPYFSSFWVEAIPFLWWLILWSLEAVSGI